MQVFYFEKIKYFVILLTFLLNLLFCLEGSCVSSYPNILKYLLLESPVSLCFLLQIIALIFSSQISFYSVCVQKTKLLVKKFCFLYTGKKSKNLLLISQKPFKISQKKFHKFELSMFLQQVQYYYTVKKKLIFENTVTFQRITKKKKVEFDLDQQKAVLKFLFKSAGKNWRRSLMG